MRWPWSRRRPNGTGALRAVAEAKQREQERKLRQAERETPRYERLAPGVADLSDEEFVARVARAFRPRST